MELIHVFFKLQYYNFHNFFLFYGGVKSYFIIIFHVKKNRKLVVAKPPSQECKENWYFLLLRTDSEEALHGVESCLCSVEKNYFYYNFSLVTTNSVRYIHHIHSVTRD